MKCGRANNRGNDLPDAQQDYVDPEVSDSAHVRALIEEGLASGPGRNLSAGTIADMKSRALSAEASTQKLAIYETGSSKTDSRNLPFSSNNFGSDRKL